MAALWLFASSPLVLVRAESIDFDKQIAPILVSHCLECHRDAPMEGGLNLTNENFVLQGGDSGAAIDSGNAENSLLWERVSTDEMPPKHPLSDDQKETLKQWIQEGAHWGDNSLDLFTITTDTRGGRDWWSLQPLQPPPVPPLNADWSRTNIDPFILQKLQQANLHPSPESEPRQLIRRLYFDLVGLPPTPEQISAFEAEPSEAAYQKIVTELLDSHHYGQRWGRHWLDIVRFGESDGFERNFQRENAWHYRDWVIDALNKDTPYDEFVRMQLIGDLLTGELEGAAATGYWVAGVHNTTVGGSKRMNQLARQDEMEDALATLGQSFVGLTFNCARCHDHKFDPVTQAEYYQLYSSISGLGFGDKEVAIPAEQLKLDQLNLHLSQRQAALAKLNQVARDAVIDSRSRGESVVVELPVPYAKWDFDTDLNDSVGNLHGRAQGGAHIEEGALILDGQSYVETSLITREVKEKTLEAWVQLDSLEQQGGAAITLQSSDGSVFDAIVFGEIEPKRWMSGSNGFARTDSFEGREEMEALQGPVHVAIVYRADGTIIGYRNGEPYGHSVRKSDLHTFPAGESEILFGLRHKPVGGNRMLKAKIYQAAFYDHALSPEEIAATAGNSASYVSEEQLVASLTDQQRASRASLQTEIAELLAARDQQAAKAKLPVYTLVSGTGETTNVLLRGDPDNLGDVVAPGATAAIPAISSNFGLAPDAPEADRRRKLAAWITDSNNPLFTRVIVNRIWHYHFGTGIVDTPSDFGFNGGRPSHPELLDYLATQFKENGYRLKWLHRQIVSSSVYRQSTYGLPEPEWRAANAIDAGNRLLWRGNTRRLEAESLRDAILCVAGQLNDAQGGPSFKDVAINFNAGTTYFEPIEVDGPEYNRRTVYRFNPRGGRTALLDTFDCPDPSSTAPKRAVTTTPLQSLSLMNNEWVLQMSSYFAERVKTEIGDNIPAQVTRTWQLAIGRDPNESERALSEQLVSDHGLPALCRGLFNFNEFVIIP